MGVEVWPVQLRQHPTYLSFGWSCGETLDSALLSQLSKFILYLSFRRGSQNWELFHLARRPGPGRRVLPH